MEHAMELDELKHAWHALEQRLERQRALTLRMHTEARIDRARRHLRWLLLGQVVQLAIGLLLAAVFARVWIGNLDQPWLLAFGLAMHAWGVLLACSAVVEVLLVTRIGYARPVLTVQRYVATLRRWRTRVSPWLGLPFLLLWMLGPFVLAGLGARVSGTWLWLNLAVGVALVVAAWGLYRWSHHPGREALARRVDDFLGGDSLRHAQERLDEIDRFAQE